MSENFDGAMCIHGEPLVESPEERRARYLRINPWLLEFEARYKLWRQDHDPLTDEV